MARLSQLKGIVAELEKQNFDFSTLPTNSSVRAYREWASDPENREMEESSITASGSKSTLGLEAFGLPAADNASDSLVKIGDRAKTKATALGLAKFGLVTATSNHILRVGFSPAKAIVALKQAPGIRQRSNITKRYYRPRTNGSWTIPMGRVGTKFEFEVQADLAADETIVATHTITFTPERIKRG